MSIWLGVSAWFLDSWIGRQSTLSIAKVRRPKMWTIINIEGHNICNLRCGMCPYTIMTRQKEKMPMDLFRKIVDDAAGIGIKDLNLNIYSEPLLDSLLFDRINYAKSKDMSIQFTSNGLLLTRDTISTILQAGIDRIYFSFHGATKETYELIHQGGNFEVTKKGVFNLITERNKRNLTHPLIIIVVVLQKYNYKEVGDFKRLWGNLANGIHYWPVDNRMGDSLFSINPEVLYHRTSFPCGRIFNELNVISNGKAVLCCLDYDGKEIIGDLTKQTIRNVWNSPKFKKIRKWHLEGKGNLVDICSRCDLLHMSGPYWWGILLPSNIHKLALRIYKGGAG